MSLTADLVFRVGSFPVEARFEARPGETIALLGPNGSGKSSVVRALAGLIPLDSGEVLLGGEVWERPARGIRRAPQERSVGILFQEYLLFPALSVEENVAFGMRVRGARKEEAMRAARSWLERFGLGGLGERKPGQLSGGQAQRVALARALAVNPKMLLLDEPLSALDAETRRSAKALLRRVLEDYGGVKVLVTHDPVDALTLAGRMVILEGGRVAQEGTPEEVLRRPRSSYAAALVGINLIGGVLGTQGGHTIVRSAGTVIHGPPSGLPEGTGAVAAVHPRSVVLSRMRIEGSVRNVFRGKVDAIETGPDWVRVFVEGPPALVAEITGEALAELGLARGHDVWASFKASEVDIYPR